MDILIRDAMPEDSDEINRVITAAFPQPDEAELVVALRDGGYSVISLVAAVDDKIVGHIMFSRMEAPFMALGLAPVAVMPECQRSGIGSKLVMAGLKHAAQGHWQGVFVLGNPVYYERFGFSPQLARGFVSPYAGTHFMALALQGSLPVNVGKVDYAPPFAALD